MLKNDNKTISNNVGNNTSVDKNNIEEKTTERTKKDKEKVLQVAKNIIKDHKYAFEVLAEW